MFGKGLERKWSCQETKPGALAYRASTHNNRWCMHQTQLRNISPYTQETSWHVRRPWQQGGNSTNNAETVCLTVHTPHLAKWPLCHHVADGLVQLFTHMCVVVYSHIHSVLFTHMYIDGTLVYLHVRTVVQLFTHNWFCRPLL